NRRMCRMSKMIAAFVAVVALGALDHSDVQSEVARYNFTAGWPAKFSVPSLDIASSAPGLLASGSYKLDLEVSDQRLVGRLQRGRDVVETIPFSIEGCESVKTPRWARRATVRGMPPAA